MNFEKILRNILIYGIFLIPFIPFIVLSDFFFPFITGKNFAFRILVEILFGSWIILALRNKEFRPKFSWILIAVTAFIGIIAIADLQGANPMKSLWSNFERMEGLVTLIHLLAYFLIIGTVLKTQNLWTKFFNISVGASVIMSIIGVNKLLTEENVFRIDGTFGNATYLAIYMLFHVFITAILLAKWRGSNWVRYVYVVAIVLQIVNLYYTATRGAILGFIGGVLLTAILISLFERDNKIIRKIGIGILASVIIVVGGFFAIKNTEFVSESKVLSRFSTISFDAGTTQARFLIWNMAIEGVKEKPLFGWGQENFNLVFNKNYDPALFADEQWFDRVHNIIFDWLVVGGILGLLSYLFIPFATLFYIWKAKVETFSFTEKSLLTGMLAGYGFHNMFVFDNLISYILFFSILAYVYALTNKPFSGENFVNKNIDVGTINRLVTPLIIIAVVFSVYFFNAKGILASRTLIQALQPQESFSENIALFRKALDYNSFANQEIREQMIQASAQANSLNIDLSLKQELFDLTITELDKQIKSAPDDVRHVLFMGSLLNAYRQYEVAESYFEEAVILSPNKQVIRFALASNLIALGRNEEALLVLEDTVKLDEDFNLAHIRYSMAATYSDKRDLADQILLDKFGSVIIDDSNLLQVYLDSQQYERAGEIIKIRIEKTPDNSQLHVGLASLYIELGRREDAVLEIETAIEIDPNFKDQGEYFIREIRAGRNP